MTPAISVSVRLYDQYGNGIRQNAAGDAYQITLTLDGIVTEAGCRQTPIRSWTVSTALQVQ